MKKAILSMTAVVIMTLVFVSCGNSGNNGDNKGNKAEQGIVGNWYYDDNTFYAFNEDGTGSYTFSGSSFGNFTYTASDGKLTLNYEGFTEPTVLNYKIDGKTLTILTGEGNLGSSTEFTRK